MTQIFFSYASKSKKKAKLLIDHLRRSGADTIWIDRENLSPGDYIAPKLRKEVEKSDCCVLYLDSNSQTSEWCMAEVGAFWGADKPIFIYRQDDKLDVPPYLAGIKSTDDHDELVRACLAVPASQPKHASKDPIVNLLRQNGLANAFRIPLSNHDRERRVEQLVLEELSSDRDGEFRLLASSGFNYLQPIGKVWQSGLGEAIEQKAAHIDVVLESPFSSFAITRALANQVKHDHWVEKAPFAILSDLNSRPNVNIRVTEHPVNCSLFFNRQSVFYDPYLWARRHGRTENNFWVFEFRLLETDYDCYKLLSQHFDFLCKYSLDLNEFLPGGEDEYRHRRDEFKAALQHKRGAQ